MAAAVPTPQTAVPKEAAGQCSAGPTTLSGSGTRYPSQARCEAAGLPLLNKLTSDPRAFASKGS